MKPCKLLAILTVALLSRMAMGDTLSLVGGMLGNFSTGWWGEAWKSGHWCGDTLQRDLSPDTVYEPSDTIFDLEIVTPISDTTITTSQTQIIDSLVVTTISIQTRTVLRDSATDPVVDIVNDVMTVTDSSLVVNCFYTDFIVDTGSVVV